MSTSVVGFTGRGKAAEAELRHALGDQDGGSERSAHARREIRPGPDIVLDAVNASRVRNTAPGSKFPQYVLPRTLGSSFGLMAKGMPFSLQERGGNGSRGGQQVPSKSRRRLQSRRDVAIKTAPRIVQLVAWAARRGGRP
jgi:hypothetical protein